MLFKKPENSVYSFSQRIILYVSIIFMGIFAILGANIPLIIYLYLKSQKPAMVDKYPLFLWSVFILLGFIFLLKFFAKLVTKLFTLLAKHFEDQNQDKRTFK